MDFNIIGILNNSKLMSGVALLMLNYGGKYVQGDLSKTHDMIFSNEYVKKIIIFCMFFIATRDVASAFLLSILYVIVIDGILNGNKKYCLIPKRLIPNSISKSDYEKAKDVIKHYEMSKHQDINPNSKEMYQSYLQQKRNTT